MSTQSAKPRKRKRGTKRSEEDSFQRAAYPHLHEPTSAENQQIFIENFGKEGCKDQTGVAGQAEPLAPLVAVEKMSGGGICARGFKPGPGMRNGFRLPGKKDLEREQEGNEAGYTFQEHQQPFHIGPMTDLIVDGQKWAEEVNAYISSVSDGLPKVPMIGCMIGGIGAGKSTALATILSVYAAPECFDEVHCFSQSLGLDPLIMTVQYCRNPLVKMEFHTELDFNFLKKLYEDVLEEHAEYAKLAKIGKYHKPDTVKAPSLTTAKLKAAMQETHSVVHPYTNEDGTHHGEKLRLPAYGQSATKFMSPFERHMHQIGGPTRTTEGGGYQRKMVFHSEREHRLASLKQQDQLPFSRLFDESHRKLFLEPHAEPRLTNTRDLTSVVIDMHVEDPDFNAVQARHKVVTEALEKGQKLEIKKKRTRKLLVFDDCSYAFHRQGATEFKRWITMIRHTNCAAMFVFHQVTAVPPIVRTCATHLFLWHVNCAKEMKRLEDEWGGCVPDFMGAYHAATSRQPGHEKDFLFVDLRLGEANRGFAGKVIPSKGVLEGCRPATGKVSNTDDESSSEEENGPAQTYKKAGKA